MDWNIFLIKLSESYILINHDIGEPKITKLPLSFFKNNYKRHKIKLYSFKLS